MKDKKRGFHSLSDSAELLKVFRNKLAASSDPDRSKSEPAAKPACRDNPFSDIERQLLEKANYSPTLQESFKRGAAQEARKQMRPATLTTPRLKKAYQERLHRDSEPLPSKDRALALPVDPRQSGEDAFQRISKLVANSSPAIEARPEAVSPQTRTVVEEAIARGAQANAATPHPDLDDGFIVGFDLGTSSLKIAVRQPYKAGDPFAVMPVPPELRSGAHPYLWQTAFWYSTADQSFSLLPGPSCEIIEGFKTGIIGANGGERVRSDIPVTRSEAAVAFITLQVAHLLGWYQEARPLRGGGERPLSINVGIPVAAQDDLRAFRDFKRIVAAANALVPTATKLTLQSVREAYYSLGDELPSGWNLIPELTAAIAGYAASPHSQSGSHMLVDVGASTLDIVAFNLLRGERISVISAAVELLGSASLDLASADGISCDDFMRACNHQFYDVFTRQACNPARGANGFSPVRRSKDVQLVTSGGGCATRVHAQFIATMIKPGVLGTLPILRPEAPVQGVSSSCDLSRLLLAYGLTRDIPELLELRLPSQVPDIAPLAPGPDPYVSKDLT